MRIVSLVPSLTETLVELGVGPDQLVGRSAFCVEPAETVSRIKVVGGTKTPSLRRILALQPDLALMDREENRQEDAEALRAEGIAVHDVLVKGPADVPAMLRELGRAVGFAGSAEDAARSLEREIASIEPVESKCALILVWKDPYMAIAPDRYGARLLETLGYQVPRVGEGPYPEVSGEAMAQVAPDLVVLPDEPYAFSAAEGHELAESVGARVIHVDGQDLLWYGTRTGNALRRLRAHLSR